MTSAAFWAWVWALNMQRPKWRSPKGYFYRPSVTNLAHSCGVSHRIFPRQEERGLFPTVAQGHRLARALGVPFAEVEKRADLRRERPSNEINMCLTCPLDDCEAGEKGCPLMRF